MDCKEEVGSIGEIQAIQYDCDLLAVLRGKDVVEERGFAGAQVSCRLVNESGAMRSKSEQIVPVTIVMGTFFSGSTESAVSNAAGMLVTPSTSSGGPSSSSMLERDSTFTVLLQPRSA